MNKEKIVQLLKDLNLELSKLNEEDYIKILLTFNGESRNVLELSNSHRFVKTTFIERNIIEIKL